MFSGRRRTMASWQRANHSVFARAPSSQAEIADRPFFLGPISSTMTKISQVCQVRIFPTLCDLSLIAMIPECTFVLCLMKNHIKIASHQTGPTMTIVQRWELLKKRTFIFFFRLTISANEGESSILSIMIQVFHYPSPSHRNITQRDRVVISK